MKTWNSQTNKAAIGSKDICRCVIKIFLWQEIIKVFVKNDQFQIILCKRMAGKSIKWLKQSLNISLRKIHNKPNSSKFSGKKMLFYLKFIICHNSILV